MRAQLGIDLIAFGSAAIVPHLLRRIPETRHAFRNRVLVIVSLAMEQQAVTHQRTAGEELLRSTNSRNLGPLLATGNRLPRLDCPQAGAQARLIRSGRVLGERYL